MRNPRSAGGTLCPPGVRTRGVAPPRTGRPKWSLPLAADAPTTKGSSARLARTWLLNPLHESGAHHPVIQRRRSVTPRTDVEPRNQQLRGNRSRHTAIDHVRTSLAPAWNSVHKLPSPRTLANSAERASGHGQAEITHSEGVVLPVQPPDRRLELADAEGTDDAKEVCHVPIVFGGEFQGLRSVHVQEGTTFLDAHGEHVPPSGTRADGEKYVVSESVLRGRDRSLSTGTLDHLPRSADKGVWPTCHLGPQGQISLWP